MSLFDKIAETAILPVIKIEKSEYAVPLAQALRNGGVSVIEVTLRSECALDAIMQIKETFPDMTVGAGTVLTTDLVDQAIDAGADIIVTPGFNMKTVEYCVNRDICIIPGAVTASDLELGVSMGLHVFKYFPAESMGGLPAIELLSGPFPKIKFIPTGGMNHDLLPKYLAKEFILACGGSYMAKSDLIRQGRWDEITRLTREAIKASMGFQLAHIGINHDNSEQANYCADWFCRAFEFTPSDHRNAVFAGTAVESLKCNGSGTKGHIGFFTLSMSRALPYLRSKGFRFREDSIVLDAAGKPRWAYFADEVDGFAVHIVQK